MARQSADSKATTSTASGVLIKPPAFLTPSERKLWLSVTNAKPSEWFTDDTVPLLVEYVRAASMCDLLDTKIKAVMKQGDTPELVRLSKVRTLESTRLATFAVKMRIAQQSRYDALKAGRRAHGPSTRGRPWDD